MKSNTSVARFQTKNCRESCGQSLDDNSLLLLVILDAAVDPNSTRLAAAVGSGAAAVSQQGLRVEHNTRVQTGGVPMCGIPTEGNKNTVHA